MIVPVTLPQPPPNEIVYENVIGPVHDEIAGVPLIVITFPDKVAVIPLGKPDATILVTPVVAIVIGVNGETLFTVGLEDGVPAVHPADVVQGTPVQFSKAAFFQRTLISSTLKEDLRLIPSILSDS
jgi:hypothetical protein